MLTSLSFLYLYPRGLYIQSQVIFIHRCCPASNEQMPPTNNDFKFHPNKLQSSHNNETNSTYINRFMILHFPASSLTRHLSHVLVVALRFDEVAPPRRAKKPCLGASCTTFTQNYAWARLTSAAKRTKRCQVMSKMLSRNIRRRASILRSSLFFFTSKGSKKLDIKCDKVENNPDMPSRNNARVTGATNQLKR